MALRAWDDGRFMPQKISCKLDCLSAYTALAAYLVFDAAALPCAHGALTTLLHDYNITTLPA